jgi:hypothetical protein
MHERIRVFLHLPIFSTVSAAAPFRKHTYTTIPRAICIYEDNAKSNRLTLTTFLQGQLLFRGCIRRNTDCHANCTALLNNIESIDTKRKPGKPVTQLNGA